MENILAREWTSREMTVLRECSNHQRVILIVHLRLYTVTFLDLSHCLGLLTHMHTNLIAIFLLDDIVAIIDAY